MSSDANAATSPQVMTAPFEPTVPAMEDWLVDNYRHHARCIGSSGAASFDAVAERSKIVSRALLASNLPKGCRVGMLMPNGPEFLAALTGIIGAGGHAVMLSTLARPAELAHMIRHSDIDTLLMVPGYLGRNYVSEIEVALPSLTSSTGAGPLRLEEAPFLRSVWIMGHDHPVWAKGCTARFDALSREVSGEFLALVRKEIVPADPALMIYSSGVTSEPKAIVHSNGNLARHAWRMSRYMTYAPGDRLMTTMPFFWVGGLCTSAYAANLRGAAIVCPERPSVDGMREAVDRLGVTHAALWPAQLNALISSPGFGDVRQRLKPTSSQQLSLFGLATPDCTPNALGMTETLGCHTMELFPGTLPDGHAGSFGRPVPGYEHRIVDPETGLPVAVGETGEILVRGGSLMQGFHRRERSDVFRDDGFYNTGDLGCVGPDGHMYFKGRSGDIAKVSGANVSLSEVEFALMQLPGVGEAVVVNVPTPDAGDVLVAAVVPMSEATLHVERMREDLRERIASYKVPRKFVIMDGAGIPRTASAKVRRAELRDMLIASSD